MENHPLFYLALCITVWPLTTGSVGEGKLTFAAIGDFGGCPQAPYTTYTQRRLAKVMAAQIAQRFGIRFIVGLGDNFYFNGVKNVEDPRFRRTFEDVYTAPVLKAAKWYMIAGNHDHNGNVSGQIAYSNLSTRWHFPHFYYTLVEKIPGTSATVQLVMIDTTLLCFKRVATTHPSSENQLRWIRKTLQSSTADYLLVNGHHPVLSAGMHGNTNCLLDKLKPLLEEYDVTAYFSGHDHNLQHIKEQDSSVHYFVSGSGNFYNSVSGNRRHLPHKSLQYFYGGSGAFTLVEATTDSLNLTMIDEYDKKMHTASLTPRTSIDPADRQTIPSNHSVLDDFFSLQTSYNKSPVDPAMVDDYDF